MAYFIELKRDFFPGGHCPRGRREWIVLLHRLMQLGLIFYILLLPFGRAFREIGSITAVSSLILVYLLGGWTQSNLRRFPLRWLFLAFMGLLLFKSVHSVDMRHSLEALAGSSYTGFLLFLAGIEFVRSRRDIPPLVWAFVLMASVQGLIGIYQSVTGFHAFVYLEHRLTGSFHSPRVGNLMALALPMGFALPALLPRHWSPVARSAAAGALLIPALVLLIGAQTRSAWIGMVCALVAFFYLFWGRKHAAVVFGGLVMTTLGMGRRFSLEMFLNDPRWQIWGDALEVFFRHPLLGSGVDTFLQAKIMHGITIGEFSHIAHPHSTYFQLLAETGIIGLSFFLVCMAAYLLQFGRSAKRILKVDRMSGLLALGLFCSVVSYLATSASAHDFFHEWWLGLPMAILGVNASVCGLLDPGPDR
jgi:O-antigen ligase